MIRSARFVLLFGIVFLPGCHNTAQGVKHDTKRALDKTGEGIEKAADKTGKGVQKAADKTGKGASESRGQDRRRLSRAANFTRRRRWRRLVAP